MAHTKSIYLEMEMYDQMRNLFYLLKKNTANIVDQGGEK
jgi:hypothetical protein